MLTKHPVESKRTSDKELMHIPMVGRRSGLFHQHFSKTQEKTFCVMTHIPFDQ